MPKYIPSNETYPEDAKCKKAFLRAAGVKDDVPYASLNMDYTISALRTAAGIYTFEMIGPSHAAARQLTLRALKNPASAQNLGTRMKPLLVHAVKEGRILPETCLPNPDWQESNQKHLKKIFFDSTKILQQKDFERHTIDELMDYFYKLLSANIGLSYSTIANRFNPKTTESYVSTRLNADVQTNAHFVSQFAAAIRPELDQGVKEGWLDADSKKPHSFESILSGKLGIKIFYAANGMTGSKKNKEALLYCLKYCESHSELPMYAIGPMIGLGSNWVSAHFQEGTNLSIQPYDVAKIADAIRPYVAREKRWNGVLEITNPNFIHNHQIIKNYLEERVVSLLKGKHKIPTPLSNTLGATLTQLREIAHLTRFDFGKELSKSVLTTLEANCFNPHCLDDRGQIIEALRSKLDHFAEVVAAHWPTHSHKPTTKALEVKARQTSGTHIRKHTL